MNEKINAWGLALFIPLILLLSYLINYSFEYGFYSYFKIPTELIQTDILNRIQICFFIFIFLSLFIANLIYIYVARKHWWLLLINIFTFIILPLYFFYNKLYLLWVNSSSELVLTIVLFIALLIIFLSIFFAKQSINKSDNINQDTKNAKERINNKKQKLKNLIKKAEKLTYEIKTIENTTQKAEELSQRNELNTRIENEIQDMNLTLQEIENLSHETNELETRIQNFITTTRLRSLSLMLIIMPYFLMLILTIGIITAKNKTVFYTYTQKSQTMVILKIYGNDMLCTPLNRASKSIEPKFILIKAEELQKENIFIKPETIGPLKIIK